MARRLPLDPLTLVLLGVVVLASLAPVRGDAAVGFARATTVGIGVLFFLHGAKLSGRAILDGLLHWRLHLAIFSMTFLVFPLYGLALSPLARWLLSPELYAGVLFLCALPATVQSSIALTSIARGNLAAAVCSASLSTMIGVVATPLLLRVILPESAGVHITLDAIPRIALQIVAPFAAGQLARRWIAAWVEKHKAILKWIDQGSILAIVYLTFSEAAVAGLWQRVGIGPLAAVLFVSTLLLGAALATTTLVGRRWFHKDDEVALVFCGSKKSLASGVPMARVLFPAAAAGTLLLPLMLFHQLQLVVGAALATRYGRRS